MSRPGDHFSRQSAGYARYRPTYPDDLFEWIATHAPARDRVWDCATGGGQAAGGLRPHFAEVVATDLSPNQIAHAVPLPGVTYHVAPAERSRLADRSVDAVTVGQALHWFDVAAFATEARRVLRPGGLVVAWCYELFSSTPAVDAVVDRLYREVVGPYWPPERRFVEDGYLSLPFPFDRIATPALAMTARWDLAHVVGFLGTWSAVQRYRDDRGSDPLDVVRDDLVHAWADPGARRELRWPLGILAGR